MHAETITLKNAAGDIVIVNKPKKKALAELTLALKEERAPELPEPDREAAQVYQDFLAAGFKEAK